MMKIPKKHIKLLKKVEAASLARFDNAYNDFKRSQKEHSKRLIKSLIKEIK